MDELDRRSLLKALAAFPFGHGFSHQESRPAAVHVVKSGADRTGYPHKAVRAGSHLDFKVLTSETNGAMFIMENRNMIRGGPPRHVHFEQEEWFYLVDGGEVVMEIGDQKLQLKPGDSVLAPRKVPHVWAYLGDRPGRMLFAFTPAANVEAFFNETSKPGLKLGDARHARLYETHGMKLLGPPLLGW